MALSYGAAGDKLARNGRKRKTGAIPLRLRDGHSARYDLPAIFRVSCVHARRRVTVAVAPAGGDDDLEHDPEKRKLVFGKDHAPLKGWIRMTIQTKVILI